jgi:hypothetical protein
MKLARTGIMAAAMLAVATLAYAQKPDFSGTWTPEQAATGGGGQRGGMAGPMMVKQTADTLTTEMTRGENKIVSTYKLDGSPSENKMMGRGGGGEVVTKSTAKWDGNKLVISTERPGQDGQMMTSTQTWSMEGGNLVIERPGRDGAVTKTVYKKTT